MCHGEPVGPYLLRYHTLDISSRYYYVSLQPHVDEYTMNIITQPSVAILGLIGVLL